MKPLILFNPPESARAYSSIYATQVTPGIGHARSMIDSRWCWIAHANVAGQWMHIDAGAGREVYGVVTQGRPGYEQRVTSYRVEVLLSGSWVAMRNEVGSFTFTGNTDRDTHVQHRFRNSVTTRYVKFFPLSWTSHIAMRAGLLILPPTPN